MLIEDEELVRVDMTRFAVPNPVPERVLEHLVEESLQA